MIHKQSLTDTTIDGNFDFTGYHKNEGISIFTEKKEKKQNTVNYWHCLHGDEQVQCEDAGYTRTELRTV